MKYPVVPHAGTWIEIFSNNFFKKPLAVVPHAGTWIEIDLEHLTLLTVASFPTRERGLKYLCRLHQNTQFLVVPHAGTWIEIKRNKSLL